MDFRRKDWPGPTAVYIGPDEAMTWTDRILRKGDTVEDPGGLLVKKAPSLWAPQPEKE